MNYPAASGGEFNPSWQHPKQAINSGNRVIPSWVWVLPRLKGFLTFGSAGVGKFNLSRRRRD